MESQLPSAISMQPITGVPQGQQNAAGSHRRVTICSQFNATLYDVSGRLHRMPLILHSVKRNSACEASRKISLPQVAHI